MKPFLIGIAGPSCSGKSEVTRRLARILRAPALALDHYYRDLKHVPFEERVGTNFDAPESLDAQLIEEHVRMLGKGIGVDEPTYDFAHHVRAEAVNRVPPANYVIVEGLFVLYWPAVHDLLDFKVYITADHDTCLARRIFRDMRERGRTEESVRAQFEATVRPMAELHLAPTMQHADLVLAGVAPVNERVRQAIDVWQIVTE